MSDNDIRDLGIFKKNIYYAQCQKWRLGSGIMGEQGAEFIHAHTMRLETTYQGIPDAVQRLKQVIQEQIIESDPTLTEMRPEAKKRKPDPA